MGWAEIQALGNDVYEANLRIQDYNWWQGFGASGTGGVL